MPLPAIGAAAARAGAAAGRAGARVEQAAEGTIRKVGKPKKPAGPRPPGAGAMPTPQVKLDRLFTVEGVMMLVAAAIIDALGFIEVIPIIGSVLSYLIDIVGILLIGGWIMFFQSGKTPMAVGGRGGKLGKWFVRIFCGGGELIPVLGALPLWTVLVLFELITE